MSALLLIRHAETDMAGAFCGHTDPPVNARGSRQIEAMIAALSICDIDAIYTSDLERARSTAEQIALAFHLPVIAQSDLREIHFGAWEGLRWSEIELRDPEYARQWITDYPNLPAPQGELFADFKGRVLQAISRLRSQHRHCPIAVVTHGGVMRIVLQELCSKTSEEAWALTKPYCASFLYPCTTSTTDSTQEKQNEHCNQAR